MAKMVNLRSPKSDRETDMPGPGAAIANPENEGVAVNLEHHHLEKMGLGGSLKSGDAVDFHGSGKVERSESRTDENGERHSATIRLHKGAIDHEPSADEQRGDLKGEIEKTVAAAEKA